MRRHVLIGRMGPDDNLSIPVAPDEVATELKLVASNKRFDQGIGRALDDLPKLGVFPTEIGLDLLMLAAHVHAADTRISRTTESQDTWTREIRLIVPVSDTVRWMDAKELLDRMLNFLTGDRWNVGFRRRPERFVKAVRKRPKINKPDRFTDLSLFSGGLDSLIGAIDLLESGRVPLLISHAGDGATSDAQKTLYNVLKKRYPNAPFARTRVWMNFPAGLVAGSAGEDTTRGRSFLFFACGVFAGSGLDAAFTLKVPENGLVALNVPLDTLRLGSNSTRTTHPFYMSCWKNLVKILGITATVENPYWSKTKGEMIAECANLELLRVLIPDSMSCSSPTKGRWQGQGIQHCGYCLPCIIRRAAIRRGLGSDATTYTLSDLDGHPLNTREAEGQQVRSFQVAIRRLEATPAIASALIYKSGPLVDQGDEQKQALAAVYSRGLLEVAAILANAETRPSA
jgi:hypothetical protein